jgi:hypothetical protein
MHFEVLVEDQSGKRMLDHLVPKIVEAGDTFRVHAYKGIGRVPKGLKPGSDPKKRILLDQLPKLLAGYGKAFSGYGAHYEAAVILVCDLDSRNKAAFERELHAVAAKARPTPAYAICLAIEEGEAWFLGDKAAIRSAYPHARETVLNAYVNDSICGTWEVLADALFPGGSNALSARGWMAVGAEKSQWAEAISPLMVPSVNQSPSFQEFVKAVGKFTRT